MRRAFYGCSGGLLTKSSWSASRGHAGLRNSRLAYCSYFFERIFPVIASIM
jgi:hypothetical protein